MLVLGAKEYTLKDEKVKKCIRMELTVLKIVIWVGKLLVSWSQFALYGDP